MTDASRPRPDGPGSGDSQRKPRPTTARDQQLNRRDLRVPLASDSFLRPSFTLEQIRTFLAVAAREHVTHAAKMLRLSQPAVTQQVQLLERALGVRLLERVGRSVRLTDAGVEVAGACLLVMRSLENVETMAQALRELDLGSVVMGASDLTVDYFLPPLVTEFVAAHPRINVGVVVVPPEQLHQQVAAGYLDCGLVDGSPPPPELHLHHVQVAATEVVLVAHRRDVRDPGARQLDQTLLTLRHLEWAQGSAAEALVAQVQGEYGKRLPRLQIGSMEAARRSVLHAGGFTTAMPSIAIQDELRSGTLVPLGRPSEPLPVIAVRRQGPDSPAVEALWRILSRTAEA